MLWLEPPGLCWIAGLVLILGPRHLGVSHSRGVSGCSQVEVPSNLVSWIFFFFFYFYHEKVLDFLSDVFYCFLLDFLQFLSCHISIYRIAVWIWKHSGFRILKVQHVLDLRKIVREICKASKHIWQKVALRSTSCCCPSACSVSGAWLIPKLGWPSPWPPGCWEPALAAVQLCTSASATGCPWGLRDWWQGWGY